MVALPRFEIDKIRCSTCGIVVYDSSVHLADATTPERMLSLHLNDPQAVLHATGSVSFEFVRSDPNKAGVREVRVGA